EARALGRSAARLRQHVVAHLPVRGRARAQGWRRETGRPRDRHRARARLRLRAGAARSARRVSVTPGILTAFVVATMTAQRLFELRVAARNEARMRARGGVDFAGDPMRGYVALHVLLPV